MNLLEAYYSWIVSWCSVYLGLLLGILIGKNKHNQCRILYVEHFALLFVVEKKIMVKEYEVGMLNIICAHM